VKKRRTSSTATSSSSCNPKLARFLAAKLGKKDFMEKYEFDGSTTLKPLINKNQDDVDFYYYMILYVYKVNKTAEFTEKIFGKSVSIAVLMSLSKAGVLAPCVAGTCGNIGYIAVKEYATVYDDYVYENNDWDLHFKLMRGVVDRLHQAGYSFNNNV
jgi:hypothetical protein